MKCSICSNEIIKNYCPECGQYFKAEKITTSSILKEMFSNVFSLEKSVINNFKMGLFHSKELIENYWKGFRGFYYSPSRFLTIAALFTLFDSFFTNDFLGVHVSSVVAPQFTILIINVLLLSLLSYLVYLKQRKSFYQHLVLNIYNVSIWTIFFVPVSMLLNFLNAPTKIELCFFLPYHLTIMIWNSKAFNLNKISRVIHISAGFIILYGVIFFLSSI